MAYRTRDEIVDLIRAFERQTLPKRDWTHAAHLTAALWYMGQCDERLAAARMVRGIRRLNRVHGVDAYHETITRFWLAVTRRHLDEIGRPALDVARFNTFVERFARPTLIRAYFSPGVLADPAARLHWVPPDRRPLDGPWPDEREAAA